MTARRWGDRVGAISPLYETPQRADRCVTRCDETCSDAKSKVGRLQRYRD